jgi:hypothetical protein
MGKRRGPFSEWEGIWPVREWVISQTGPFSEWEGIWPVREMGNFTNGI